MSTILVNGRDININQYRSDWALALMAQGIIVKLNVSWWRARSSLKADELGIKFGDNEVISFMKKYVRLGSESLLPPEIIAEIGTIEQKSRNNLKEYSFDTVWGKFVPYTAFAQWQDNDKLIRDDFFLAANALCEKREEIVSIVRQEYKKLAKDVWFRLYNDNNPTESYIENFISKITNKIPSANAILTSFKYETTYFQIPLPSLIEDNISKAEDIKKEREVKLFNIELEKETKKRISDEYVKRKSEYIDGFLEATVSSMRKYIAEICENILQSIRVKGITNKDINKTQRDKIKSIVKKVKLLNFHDDTPINDMLKSLEIEVDKFKGERNNGVIIEKLQNLVDLSQEEFLPLNFNPIISSLEV